MRSLTQSGPSSTVPPVPSAARGRWPFEVPDLLAQIAADAPAVCHHAAEALLRFACARFTPSQRAGGPCLWAEIACGPTRVVEVIDRLNRSA